ncbi:MAG: cyanophycinase [Pseudomonadota bacterium]
MGDPGSHYNLADLGRSAGSLLPWLLNLAVWTLFVVPAHAGLLDIFASPPKGNLIIVGGGDTPSEVQARFVTLSGGPGKARIAILPMASTKFDEEVNEVMEDFRRLGAETQILNLSYADAQNETIAKQLGKFDAYWFSGGDQSRLSSVLVGTAALDTIVRRHQEGAMIGGTSAGASVMSSVMLTGRWRSPNNEEEAEQLNIAKGMKEVAKGFGIMKGAIIDQHFMKRARYNRLLSAVLDHPQLIGVGIDEETALLVRSDGVWEVLGKYYVKVFDARRAHIIDDDGPLAKASDIRLHVLPAGSEFNAKSRKVKLPGG